MRIFGTRPRRARFRVRAKARAARSAAAAIVALSLVPGVAAAEPEVRQPETGTLAQTTLALLRYNRALCVRLAQDVQRHWRELPLTVSNDVSGEERVRQRVLEELLGDLAAARAAGDMVRELLPATRTEVDTETGIALEQLFALQTRLCDTVAYPSGGRQGFGGTATDLMLGIDREVARLGRLLVVPEAELDAALEPYLTPIQIAGVEAQGELLAYLDSLEPAPKEPSKAERMRAWHGQYLDAVRPSKQTLGRFLQARAHGDSATVRDSCRELSDRSRVLLASDGAVFEGPEPSVAPMLQQAFRALSLMANACNGGDFRRADHHLLTAQNQLAKAAAVLRPYGLAP